MINKFNKAEKTTISDELTLSCILNTIDGILEQNGRILIITTNYKDKLDSALLRPGRIDMKINFTKCTDIMMRNIIENFYNKKLSKDIKLIDDKYTPAEIVEKCFNNPNNMESVIKNL
jgi:mitochondrial chaperone BCS1